MENTSIPIYHQLKSRVSLLRIIFLVIGLILALSNNILHSTYLYFTISPRIFDSVQGDWYYSIFVNLVVDFSVIAFAANKRHIEAGIYAIGILLINLLFWKGVGIITDQEQRYNIARVIYSFMFSYSVFIFSYLITKRINQNEDQTKHETTLKALQQEQLERTKEQEKRLKAQKELQAEQDRRIRAEKETQEKQSLLEEAQKLLDKAQSDLEGYKKEHVESLSCSLCDYVGGTRRQLTDHIRRQHHNKRHNLSTLLQLPQNGETDSVE